MCDVACSGDKEMKITSRFLDRVFGLSFVWIVDRNAEW